MLARLVPIDADLARPIALQQAVLLLGRHPESDVRFDSMQVSRRHCCIAVVDDRVLIRDLGSRHGVHVNGARVEEVQIRPGDEVAIAHLIYRFEVGAAAAPAPLRLKDGPPDEPDFDLIPLDD